MVRKPPSFMASVQVYSGSASAVGNMDRLAFENSTARSGYRVRAQSDWRSSAAGTARKTVWLAAQMEFLAARGDKCSVLSASQSWAANSTSVSSTACRSKVERLITLSTSAVAVCCCSDSRSSLSRRVFSMAMTAWSAKFRHQLDLLVGEWTDLLPKDADGADQLVLLEHRHDEERPRPPMSPGDDRLRIAARCSCSSFDVGDCTTCLRSSKASHA